MAVLAVACTQVMVLGSVQRSKQLANEGRMDEAIGYAQQALTLAERTFERDAYARLLAGSQVAQLELVRGEYEHAETRLREIYEITRGLAGERAPLSVDAAMGLGALELRRGRFEEARRWYRDGIDSAEQLLGADDPRTARLYGNLVVAHLEAGRYELAYEVARKSVTVTSRVLGVGDSQAVQAKLNLAAIHMQMNRHEEAEPLLVRALEEAESSLGEDDYVVGRLASTLGSLYLDRSEYDRAESLLDRATAIFERAPGPVADVPLKNLNQRALLDWRTGRYRDAFARLEKIQERADRVYGSGDPGLAIVLANLAASHLALGAPSRAKRLLDRSLQIHLDTYGAEHQKVASLALLDASLYAAIEDLPRAIKVLERALPVAERSLGSDHPLVGNIAGSLGGLQAQSGRLDEAEARLRQAVGILESLPYDTSLLAQYLTNLASVLTRLGEYERADALLSQALELSSRLNGEVHEATSLALVRRGDLARERGDYAAARAFYERALAIEEEIVGASSRTMIQIASPLLTVLLDLDETAEVPRVQDVIDRARSAQLEEVLSFASERQRLEFARALAPDFAATVLGDAARIARSALRYKGRVLESVIEDRSRPWDASDRDRDGLLLELARVRQARLDASLTSGTGRAAQREILDERLEELEGRLASGSQPATGGASGPGAIASLESVQLALGDREALVEYVRYRTYLGRGRFVPHYGAVVIRSRADPVWVPLGPAGAIDDEIARYRAAMQSAAPRDSVAATMRRLRSLHDRVWQPVRERFAPETRKVWLSPDGALHQVSFALLMESDQHFVGETHTVEYLSSGRDLVLPSRVVRPPGRIALLAAPRFDLGLEPDAASPGSSEGPPALPGSAGDPDSSERADLSRLRLGPLPGARREAVEVAAEVETWDWEVETLFGEKATEAALRAIDTPGVLHVATHGFFVGAPTEASARDRGAAGFVDDASPEWASAAFELDSSDGPAEERTIPIALTEDPMYRSGFALAGAARTLRSWKRGVAPPTDSDGIVLADEVLSLDLRDTWLVVVSACESGTGPVQAGEGVLGLQRAFQAAGAAHVLLALWPVDDAATALLMRSFYQALDRGRARPAEALASAQRAWVSSHSATPGDRLEALRTAGAFVVSSAGKAGPSVGTGPEALAR